MACDQRGRKSLVIIDIKSCISLIWSEDKSSVLFLSLYCALRIYYILKKRSISNESVINATIVKTMNNSQ